MKEIKTPQTVEDISTPEALLHLGIKSAEINGELQILDEGVDSPSEAAILAAKEEVLAIYQQNEYRKKRAVSYPSITDQLDALFHAGLFPAEMAAKIQAVKDQFPKG